MDAAKRLISVCDKGGCGEPTGCLGPERVSKGKQEKGLLVVQWLGTSLPVQGTWVLSLVQEDSMWCRAEAHAPQLLEPAHPRVYALQQEKPAQ